MANLLHVSDDTVSRWERGEAILGSKNPYALNVVAKKNPQPGMYWHGRNLRISVRYLLNAMEAMA